MNKATPIGQLPYIPPQGSNDPRVVDAVMNDIQQQQQLPPVINNNNVGGNQVFLSDDLVKEAGLIMVAYVLLNTDFINQFLLQNLPQLVQIDQPHFQTICIKAALLGVIFYVIKKFLI